MRNTDVDWSKVAEDNPYWGVLSVEEFRGVALSPESEARFFASGEQFIFDTLAFARRHLAPDLKIDRALDFGCGVGRLLLPLAKLSAKGAVGVDVAPKMLELARANLQRAGFSGSKVVMGDDELSLVEGRFDFVNSFITLQHIPPERGLPIIERLLRILKVGGVFSLQMTYAKERRFFIHEQARAGFYRRTGNVIQDLLPVSDRRPEGTITMYDYDLNELVLLVSATAGEPVMMLPTNHDGHRGVHLIGVKAREK